MDYPFSRQETSLQPAVKCVDSCSKLISVCEQGPGNVKMPYTIQLAKQLRKELNIERRMKEIHETVEGEHFDLNPTPEPANKNILQPIKCTVPLITIGS